MVGSCIGALASQQFDEMHAYQVQTCVVEAVTNCIRHSYKGVAGSQVEIHYQTHADKHVIDIVDTGNTMNAQIFLNTSAEFQYDPLDIENLPEGGWGLKLIKAWMDESNYYTQNGVNHFVFVKHLPAKINVNRA
jgi:serine/threonine-protein kinase RsbW